MIKYDISKNRILANKIMFKTLLKDAYAIMDMKETDKIACKI